MNRPTLDPVVNAAVTAFEQVVQPLVFETGIAEFPLGIWGSVFMIGHRGRCFIVTARHSLRPDSLRPICIPAGDASPDLLPLKDAWFVPVGRLLDDDSTDFVLVEVDRKRLHRRHGQSRLLNLDQHSLDWIEHRDTSQFLLIGFPEERCAIHYDKDLIDAQRTILAGRYARQERAMGAGVFSMTIDDTLGMQSFSGFSGGPVMCWVRRLGLQPQLVFCGIAIRGTPASGLVYFIGAGTLYNAVEVWGSPPLHPKGITRPAEGPRHQG
ncbi:MAG TPA: hypothetical protein VD932_02015 [Aquabacterium sp.]|nr:hypothetical protein [Aquabacterium sp.]